MNKFKVGDTVRLKKETRCTNGFKVGDICEIKSMKSERILSN